MALLHQIALTFIKNIGPVSGRVLIKHFGGVEELFEAAAKRTLKVNGVPDRFLHEADFKQALEKAAAELQFIANSGIEVIFYTDAAYPKRLHNCNDAPLLLYAKGMMNLNPQHVVSIVGTRKATDYGRQLCQQLVEELQQYPVLIASGLAAGIDTFAHKECVKLDVPTVGVLGHGFDKMYPAGNRQLAEKMQQNGGILTEYPSGTVPEKTNFPERNRIVAGMADATIVVEAGIKGGALITAEIANSYNRDVFAFPGRVGDQYSEGCNFLVQHNKAGLLTGVADLAYAMGWKKRDEKKPKEQLMMALDLPPDEMLIHSTIRSYGQPIGIDELTIRTNMPVSILAMNLLNMEMQGLIRSLPGKTYAIN